MLTFNQLLALGGLEPKDVRLLRHRDPNPGTQRQIVETAIARNEQFDRYQEEQVTEQVIKAFRSDQYFASFVVDPESKQTLFIGVWEKVGEKSKPEGAQPFGHPAHPDAVYFDLRRIEVFDEYRGRIVIDWGDANRVWVQKAEAQNKPIVEVRREIRDPAFPGYLNLHRNLEGIAGLPTAWTTALREAKGIYLLVHRTSGKQYVGSAYGDDGFFGRWCAYAQGHGGNVAMKELAASADHYHVAILEVMGSAASIEEILQRETVWKTKLGSRAEGLGLNRN